MFTCYFGFPGCGKTTFLTKIAVKELRKIKRGKSRYDKVLSNVPIGGCYPVDFVRDCGVLDIQNALILIDEITLLADNRDFKNFSKTLKEFCLLHRHYKCDLIYFTQFYNNVDKKIRDITSHTFFVRPLLLGSWAIEIPKAVIIPEQTGEIIQGYKKPKLFGIKIKYCFKPFYFKYFNSYDKPLDLKPYEYEPYVKVSKKGKIRAEKVKVDNRKAYIRLRLVNLGLSIYSKLQRLFHF